MSIAPQSGRVPDRGGEQGDVALVEAGDGVAEADGDPAGEAGGDLEDAAFAAGAGEFTGVQGGDGGVPVKWRPSASCCR
jgi:hypothetical protein